MALLSLKPCEQCWETFEPKRANQKYCSQECVSTRWREQAEKRRKQSMIDGSGGTYLKLRFEVFRRDEFTCQYCGRTVKDKVKLHIDHIVPKSKGGNLSMENLITACFDCNEGKRDSILSLRELQKVISKP